MEAKKYTNGACITVDTNIACQETITKFFVDLVGILKSNENLKSGFDDIDLNNLIVNIQPITLVNLSTQKDIKAKNGELLPTNNYINERVLYEFDRYVNSLYSNEEGKLFITKHGDKIKTDLINEFNRNPVKVISCRSYIKISPSVVNFLLKRDSNNNLNYIRKFKFNVEENRYYNDDDVELKRKELTSQIKQFKSCNCEYIERNLNNCIFNLAVYIYDKNLDINLNNIDEDDETVIDNILLLADDNLKDIVRNDLKRISLITSITENNYTLIDKIRSSFMSSYKPKQRKILNLRSIYLTLLSYFIFVYELKDEIINFYNDNNSPSVKWSKKVKSLDDNTISPKIISIMQSIENNFIDNKYIQFNIKANYIFSLLYCFCQNPNDSDFNSILFKDILMLNNKDLFSNKFSVDGLKDLTLTNEDIALNITRSFNENIDIYIHRNIETLYVDGIFDLFIFIVDNSLNFNKNVYKNLLEDEKSKTMIDDYYFNVSKISEFVGKLNYIDYNNRLREISYSNYLINVLGKNLDEKSNKNQIQINEIDKTLNSLFGECVARHVIDLPKISYNQTELKWFENKCIELMNELNLIVDKNNLNVDLVNNLRTLYFQIFDLQHDNVNSNIEDITIVQNIDKLEKEIEQLTLELNIDIILLSKIKSIINKLYEYSNPSKLEFLFEPFEYKSMTALGNEMNFIITKNKILNDKGNAVDVKSVLEDNPKYLIDYFRKQFIHFSNENGIKSFNVNVEKKPNTTKGAPDVINLNITFSSSEELHACSKFKTKFYSISDFKSLKKIVSISINKPESEVNYDDIPNEFIISWNKNTDQINALSSGEGEKNSKRNAFYLVAKGCNDKYPFYDGLGKKILKRSFDSNFELYKKYKTIRSPISPIPQKPIVQTPQNSNTKEEFPALGYTEDIVKKIQNNSNFWEAMNKNNGISSVNSPSSNASETKKQGIIKTPLMSKNNSEKKPFNRSNVPSGTSRRSTESKNYYEVRNDKLIIPQKDDKPKKYKYTIDPDGFTHKITNRRKLTVNNTNNYNNNKPRHSTPYRTTNRNKNITDNSPIKSPLINNVVESPNIVLPYSPNTFYSLTSLTNNVGSVNIIEDTKPEENVVIELDDTAEEYN